MDASHPPDARGPGGLSWTLADRRHQSTKWEEQALRKRTGGSKMKTSRTIIGVDKANPSRKIFLLLR